MSTKEINQAHIEKLKQQKRSVGLLRFTNKDDQNFSKWYSLTENLVIKSFGAKSNQVIQLHKLFIHMAASTDNEWGPKRLETKDAKEKLKDLLSVFISELELDQEEEQPKKSRGSNNTSIKIKNTQTVNQSINISVAINQIIEGIKSSEPDSQKVTEAESKLKELERELKEKSPAWAKVKGTLIWLLNFSRDTFLQVLPIILEKYKQ